MASMRRNSSRICAKRNAGDRFDAYEAGAHEAGRHLGGEVRGRVEVGQRRQERVQRRLELLRRHVPLLQLRVPLRRPLCLLLAQLMAIGSIAPKSDPT